MSENRLTLEVEVEASIEVTPAPNRTTDTEE